MNRFRRRLGASPCWFGGQRMLLDWGGFMWAMGPSEVGGGGRGRAGVCS